MSALTSVPIYLEYVEIFHWTSQDFDMLVALDEKSGNHKRHPIVWRYFVIIFGTRVVDRQTNIAVPRVMLLALKKKID